MAYNAYQLHSIGSSVKTKTRLGQYIPDHHLFYGKLCCQGCRQKADRQELRHYQIVGIFGSRRDILEERRRRRNNR
jgi:hypothetical protein